MQLNTFDLNLLRALDALLVERNVTRASERLFVTQPAMSGALQRLRDNFGDQLLVRVGREMELTPLARSLVAPVREVLLQIQATLETRPSFEPKLARRNFKVAMSDYATLVLMPAVLRLLAIEAPFMTCHVEALTELSYGRLENGELDFCASVDDWHLFGNYEPGQVIRTQKLFSDDFVCVVDRHHPDVGATMSLDQYRHLSHNVARFGRGVATIVEQFWDAAHLELNIAATAPNFSSLIFMLPGTALVATAQRRLAGMLAASLPLKIVECPLELGSLNEILVWHARNEFDPGHQFIREIFAKAAATLADQA
jgi:LysR family transcriptional regulator, nod-box dependent transcriptional activator